MYNLYVNIFYLVRRTYTVSFLDCVAMNSRIMNQPTLTGGVSDTSAWVRAYKK
jgi:hypothetical protein